MDYDACILVQLGSMELNTEGLIQREVKAEQIMDVRKRTEEKNGRKERRKRMAGKQETM